MLDVAFRCVAADNQVVHDVAPVAPMGQKAEHLALALGKAELLA